MLKVKGFWVKTNIFPY